VERAIAVDRLGAEVTSAGDAGSLLRIGVYADTGNSYPGALILDAGTIAGDSATVQDITGLTLTLAPGIYWIGGAVQLVTVTQPTVRILGSVYTCPVPLGSTSISAGQAVHGFSQSSVTGALPSTFTSSVTTLGAGVCPRIHARVAT
jgi:hypothetical protein